MNLADGMDGLASGSGALVVGAYTIIAFWQFRNAAPNGIYEAVDPRAGHAVGGDVRRPLGFLWWNAPAKIFMGDVGSRAIGGPRRPGPPHQHPPAPGDRRRIFVAETLSVMLQVASFRSRASASSAWRRSISLRPEGAGRRPPS